MLQQQMYVISKVQLDILKVRGVYCFHKLIETVASWLKAQNN